MSSPFTDDWTDMADIDDKISLNEKQEGYSLNLSGYIIPSYKICYSLLETGPQLFCTD